MEFGGMEFGKNGMQFRQSRDSCDRCGNSEADFRRQSAQRISRLCGPTLRVGGDDHQKNGREKLPVPPGFLGSSSDRHSKENICGRVLVGQVAVECPRNGPVSPRCYHFLSFVSRPGQNPFRRRLASNDPRRRMRGLDCAAGLRRTIRRSWAGRGGAKFPGRAFLARRTVRAGLGPGLM